MKRRVKTRIADPDPHVFGKLDPDPHKSEKWIRIHIKSQNSGAVEAQNGATDGRVCSQLRRGGSKKSRGVSVDKEVANSDRYDEEKDPDPYQHL